VTVKIEWFGFFKFYSYALAFEEVKIEDGEFEMELETIAGYD